MSTRAQILAEIAAQFPDNTTGLITPAKLRQVVEDVTNSCLVSETDASASGRTVLTGTPAEGAASTTLTVKYQGCADIGICYPPQTRTLEVPLPAAGAAAAASRGGLPGLPPAGGGAGWPASGYG